ncbi:MAG: hypothetical protein PUJ80_00925 [Verrucomicrobiota bacterium]|nr:hypothetical protein [Verrucomicrobiota bacterium]MDY5597197.1 hypothetical protein [Kiritimatiellia bacterium]
MAEGIGRVNERVVVDEIPVARVVGRIDVDEVDLAAMRLFEKPERGEVVALDEEVEFAAVADKTLAVLGQDGQVMLQLDVDALLVPLEDEPILLRAHLALEFVGEREKTGGVRVVRVREKCLDLADLPPQLLAPRLREVARAVRRLCLVRHRPAEE